MSDFRSDTYQRRIDKLIASNEKLREKNKELHDSLTIAYMSGGHDMGRKFEAMKKDFNDAIDFALEKDDIQFLHYWREGDISEWEEEFNEWKEKQ